MLETLIGLLRFASSLLFGVAISVLFAGIERTRLNNIAVCFTCVILLLVQSAFWWFYGIDMTSKLYPLIIHVPMIFLFSLYFKRPWLISTVSVISAYLCCQAPRWIGFLARAAFDSRLADHIFYIVSVFLAYYFLKRYVAASVRQLMEKSNKFCALLGSVPLFYYMFDYVTIYTDILYSGAKWAVQFVPSTISVFYFVFIVLYNAETQKEASAQRELDMLTAQLQLAKTEFSTLRQLQQSAAVYRHDMRHHFALLQGLASKGRIQEIKEYLWTAQSDMDTITPVRFCENETVNMILSSFAAKAKQSGIMLTVDTKIPDSLPFSDTVLCSLFSNGLENAVTATAAVSDLESRVVSVMATVHRDKLLISMENPYTGQVALQDGLPITRRANHGYGTRSISGIADAHGGQAIFNAEGGLFTLKIMLPLVK